jgi:glycosyltransferase involved in cell wall biosynthesis
VRIVYLTHQYLPRHIGGTEVYTHGLAVRAQRAGHSVRVITHVESPSLDSIHYKAERTEHDGIPVTEIHYNLSRAPDPARAEYDNPYTVELLRRELETTKPDLVHALHVMKLSGAALKLCYDMNIPVVLTLVDYWFICPRHILLRWNQQLCQGPAHDLDCMRCLHETHGFAAGIGQKFPPPLLRGISTFGSTVLKTRLPRFWRDIHAIRKRQIYLRQIVERADRVIALSDFQKEMFVHNGYSAERIQVLHHGLETAGLKPATLSPAEELEIVFVGSLVYHKGPHILLKALAQHPESRVRLLLYGDASGSNPYLESLRELVAADRRVKLMGTFPINEMGRVLETAHILAMPALWYENEPLVVKAARYVGLPVLASDIGTLASSIQHGVDGWLLPAGDIAAWANALASLNPKTLPQHSSDISIKSMDDNALELLDIYQEIYLNKRCPEQNI